MSRYRAYVMLFSLACFVDAVLVGCWAISYVDRVTWDIPGTQHAFKSADGSLTIAPGYDPIVAEGYWGFRYGSYSAIQAPGRAETFYHLTVPYWTPIVLVTLLAFWPLRKARKLMYRARHPNLCVACGYDIRATRDRCPECGTPVTKR